MRMSKKLVFPLLLVITLILMLCIALWLRNDSSKTLSGREYDASSIVGGWETEVHVINPDSDGKDAPGRLQFYFYDDLTGKQIETALGKTSQRKFTYQISDDELCIYHESGAIWKFPYSLNNDILVLEQHHASITYHRIS